jgi:hypothetical protein
MPDGQAAANLLAILTTRIKRPLQRPLPLARVWCELSVDVGDVSTLRVYQCMYDYILGRIVASSWPHGGRILPNRVPFA